MSMGQDAINDIMCNEAFGLADEEYLEGDSVCFYLHRICRETEKAYYVEVEGERSMEYFWVPKSQISIKGHDLIVPTWLADGLNIFVEE